MKPGSGAVHKACAEVCLLGDIPRDAGGSGTEEQEIWLYAHTSGRFEHIDNHFTSCRGDGGGVRYTAKKSDLRYIRVDKHGFRG